MPRQKMTGTDSPQTYEQLVERLQQVVERLELGELPLAEAVTLYEEGVALTARCQQLLNSAELRVQQLLVGVDSLTTMPWDET